MTDIRVSEYEFRGFRIDVTRRLLVDPTGEAVALTPKVFDLLLFLVENSGKTVAKDDIMSAVWPDTIVEESNLTQNISILRRALGDARGENAFIVTIPGRGYKFVADVNTVSAGPGEPEVIVEEPVTTEEARGFSTWWLVGAGIVALALAVSAVYLFPGKTDPATSRAPQTLAILPFKPLVQESADEALEIGMTDTLIARLSNSSGLVLRPLSSVRRFAGTEQDPQAAGRALGADAVLDGSIQRWGEKIRVNVRLIKVDSGEALWSATFDDKYTDIFAVQDAISAKVADALRLRLGRPENPASADRSTQNVEAYRLYLQGRLFQFKSTPQQIRQGIEFYQKAIDIDPNYALAYAGMADAYRMLPITSDVPADEAFPRSKAAALRALELNDRLAEAHVALGYVASWYEWDWRTAESEMRKAIELDPNNADAHRGLSIVLTALARHDEAINEMKAARELDPLSLPTSALEAQTLFYAGRNDDAIARLNKTFEIDPNFWIARLMLARIYIGQSRWDDALVELQKARTASGGNTEAISLAGYALARSGRPAEARKALDELRVNSSGANTPSYNIAMVYNGLGETDAALQWLEDAVKRHDVRLILLKVEHKWDNLRAEPRFIALMKRMGFD